MKRLGRGTLELLKVAEELRDAEIELEFLPGPLAGKHDPASHGAALFAFFSAMAESERDSATRPSKARRSPAPRARRSAESRSPTRTRSPPPCACATTNASRCARSPPASSSAPARSAVGTPPRPPSCACCASTTSGQPRPLWSPRPDLRLQPLHCFFGENYWDPSRGEQRVSWFLPPPP
ncbi:recombinase family protein [Streptomyces anulatus]|uniref:recombinase family protein n=1 Tax=Streptomyces anulatus TaxID=1892 RepID=UPI002277B57F|nr:recombinase family protein [Streptomyces anulatus]